MEKNSILPVTLVAFYLLFFPVCSQEINVHQEGLLKYLPQSGEAGKWERSDVPLEYKGENLYEYINGGAEIYNEYGFEEVISQDYKNPKGKTISLEIFKMKSDEAAYGIFTFKRSDKGKDVAIGNEGQIEDYYMNFWKGNFLVTLTGYDEEKETIDGLVEIAEAVDAKIESRGEIPSLVFMLPDGGLVKQSIIYLRGNIGLYNCYMFFSKNVFRFKGGVKADFDGGYQVYIFRYSDKEESKIRFDEAKESFKESEKYKDFQAVDGSFKVYDSNDNLIFMAPFQEYILIVLGAGSENTAKEVLSNIQAHIRSR